MHGTKGLDHNFYNNNPPHLRLLL